jgi:site-specific DNA-cytosine methylase
MATKCETEILTLEHYLELKAEGYEFEGQSYLFWEFMRLLNECKPKYFLLENVEMGEKWEKVLSKAIGVNGIHINSALVSAQNRKRIYWTNIGMQPGGLFGDLVSIIQQPKDKGVLLKDILETEVDEKYFLSERMINSFNIKTKKYDDLGGGFAFKPSYGENKSRTLTNPARNRMDETYIKIDKKGNIKNNQDNASCFTAGGHSGGNHSDMDLIVYNTMPRSGNPKQGGTGHLSRNDGKTYCLDTGNTNAVEIVPIKSDLIITSIDIRSDEGLRENKFNKAFALRSQAGGELQGRGVMITNLNENQQKKFNPNINSDKANALTLAQGRAGSSRGHRRAGQRWRRQPRWRPRTEKSQPGTQ